MFTVLAVDWGDVPTWISAITTLGALIAAAVLIGVEVRRDRRGIQQAERQDQADKVAAWKQGSRSTRHILVRNGSQLPIYKVLVLVVYSRGSKVLRVDSVPPGDHPLTFPDSMPGDPDAVDLELYFTDTAGRAWLRDSDGRLERLGRSISADYVWPASRGDVAALEGDDQSPL